MLSIDKINKLEKENKIIKEKLDKFADRFNDIADLTDFLEVRSEDENGYMYGEEEAIWGDGLTELFRLIEDFIDFVDEVK